MILLKEGVGNSLIAKDCKVCLKNLLICLEYLLICLKYLLISLTFHYRKIVVQEPLIISEGYSNMELNNLVN